MSAGVVERDLSTGRELGCIAGASLANLAVAATVFAVAGTAADGTELALRTTARVSLVWFLLAFCASPAFRLWPGRLTHAWLGYRRAFGVVFGLSMSIHVGCILRLFQQFAPARPPMVTTTDFTIGIPGLVFVAAMTVTSIGALQRAVGPVVWGRLHRVGIWVVWAIFILCLLDSVGRKRTAHAVLAYYVFIGVLGLAAVLRACAGTTPAPNGHDGSVVARGNHPS